MGHFYNGNVPEVLPLVILHANGIYAYSKEHALASRHHSRSAISSEELQNIRAVDSGNFIDLQKKAGCDFISDGQFLWKDLSRPFCGRGPEENLEMVRRADTNTFARRPAIESLDDIKPVDISRFLVKEFKNQQIAILGPLAYGELARFGGRIRMEEVIASYSKAVAESLGKSRSKSLAHVLISEPKLGEKNRPADIWPLEKEALDIIHKGLRGIETTLGIFFCKVRPFWEQVIKMPVDNIAVDMRPQDYFNPIPPAKNLLMEYDYIFKYDINKGIVLGCVNGRNGGFTPGKGLETPMWITEMVRLAHKKNNTISLGITFSTDEAIIPRELADAKLKNMGAAKKLLKKEGL